MEDAPPSLLPACPRALWVEVKGVAALTAGSSAWVGSPGHVMGARQQLRAVARAAALERNYHRYRPPGVVLAVPAGARAGLGEGLAGELRGMGVRLVDFEEVGGLPGAGEGLGAVVLEASTLCALVSEVTHAAPGAPEVREWAAGNAPREQCLWAEQRDPMLPTLRGAMEGRAVLAESSAVAHFEDLLGQFGGPREQARWRAQWRGRVSVRDWDGGGRESSGGAGGGGAPPRRAPLPLDAGSEWLRRLTAAGVPPLQVRAIGLARRERAVLLTANARARHGARESGVHVEAEVLRPVWLTGV